MRIRCLFICILFIFISCSTHKKITITHTQKMEFIELSYGICDVQNMYSTNALNAPSGIRYISTGFKLIEKTNVVPCIKGQQFGVNYLLKSDSYQEVPIDFVWTFPDTLTNDSGNKFKELKYRNFVSTNDNLHETYALNESYLLVKGKWKYQMFYDGNKIYEKTFQLD